MEKLVLRVNGMVCNECVVEVTNAVGGLDGVARVHVDLLGALVTVRHNSCRISQDRIIETITQEGFEVA